MARGNIWSCSWPNQKSESLMTSTTSTRPRRTRILIVEDDNLQQRVLESALEWHGYEIDLASNGLDAVRKVRESSYDLALVDYHIPEIDGLATARLIRELMGEEARPALLALTTAPEQLEERASTIGDVFDGIMTKPIRLPDLVSAIECCLHAAPAAASRQAAEDALLQKRWAQHFFASGRPPARSGQPTPPRILIVEDDDQQQLLLRSALELKGYTVESVCDGMQAIRAVRSDRYDIVLVDYHMPEVDGLATARVILDFMHEDVRPRLIGLTSALDELTARQAKTGSVFDELVAKSSNLPGLLAIIARHLPASPVDAPIGAARSMAGGRQSPVATLEGE
jgi:two-component system sensor histidine kinase/response regulator